MKGPHMPHIDRYDQDSLMSIFEHAIAQIDPEDLAFLFATGKSELEIRTQIALHLNRIKGFNQTVSREWYRHDLAVLEQGLPALVIEGKSWLHADAVDENKLMKGFKSIKHGLEQDLSKLEKTSSRMPELIPYITMLNFSIDVRMLDTSVYKNADIKYKSTHRRALAQYRTLSDLAGMGRSNISNLLSSYGIVKRAQLKVGTYLGMDVEADFYLMRPSF